MLATFLLSAAALAQADAPGLVAEATDGERRVLFVTPTANLTLHPRQSLHPQLSPAFSCVWTGVLKVVRRGRYRLSAEPAAAVLLDGREARGRDLELDPGDHPIRIEYRRPEGAPARLQVVWESDFFKPEPVPGSAFAHRERPAGLEEALRAERGRALAEELHCAACHRAGDAPLRGRRGPDLSHVGGRTNVRWLARWLEDPRRFRAGAVMPAVLHGTEPADVAAYLAGLKDTGDTGTPLAPDPARAARGKELFESVGCVSCHGEREGHLWGMGSKTDAARLARYLIDPLRVDPSGRMPSLLLSEGEAVAIAEYLVQTKNLLFEAEAPAGDAARGKAVVQSRGCLGCHALSDGGPLENRASAPPLAGLDPARGCLADAPSDRAARYALSPEGRDDLRAFLRSFAKAPDRSEAPAHALSRAVRAFRCVACHAIDAAMPVGLKEYPPALTDAGNKMRGAWLRSVLLEKKRIRPWMELRMPHFGAEAVGALAEAVAAHAGAPFEEEPSAGPPAAADVRDGVKLLGAAGGLSCISCHDWKDRVALATRGPDLTEMGARLREDWFRRWLRDPGRLQPGTSMPSFFGSVPEAEAERKMDLLWAALRAGKSMPMPEGFPDPSGYLLAVKDAPVTVRTFLPESGGRAVAVGLPGGESYCWDTDLCRLRYAWHGGFLDMAPAWSGRGGQPVRLLGERYYVAPDRAPLRVGDPDREPRHRFKGYALAAGLPEFLYELDGTDVRERVHAAGGGLGLTRTYRIESPPGDVWFLAGEAKGVRFSSAAGEWQGGRLRVPRARAGEFSVTLSREASK